MQIHEKVLIKLQRLPVEQWKKVEVYWVAFVIQEEEGRGGNYLANYLLVKGWI